MHRIRVVLATCCLSFALSVAALQADGPYRDPDPAALARQTLDHADPEVLEWIESDMNSTRGNPLPLVEYGYGEALAGRAQTARDSYAQALELASLPVFERRVRWSFGWALLQLDAFDEAIAQWQLAAALHGGRPFWLPYSLAVAHWSAGRKEDALDWYQVAVDSFPGHWADQDGVERWTRNWKQREREAIEAVFSAWNSRQAGPFKPSGSPAG